MKVWNGTDAQKHHSRVSHSIVLERSPASWFWNPKRWKKAKKRICKILRLSDHLHVTSEEPSFQQVDDHSNIDAWCRILRRTSCCLPQLMATLWIGGSNRQPAASRGSQKSIVWKNGGEWWMMKKKKLSIDQSCSYLGLVHFCIIYIRGSGSKKRCRWDFTWMSIWFLLGQKTQLVVWALFFSQGQHPRTSTLRWRFRAWFGNYATIRDAGGSMVWFGRFNPEVLFAEISIYADGTWYVIRDTG